MINQTPKHLKNYFLNNQLQFNKYQTLGKYSRLTDYYDYGSDLSFMENEISEEDFFKYYFTPTKYINVEELVDIDTIRI